MNVRLAFRWVRNISVVFLLTLLPLQVFARQDAALQAPIEPSVLEQAAANGQTTFWVILREQANLAPAFKIGNWEARGRFVYNRLQAVANNAQPGLRALLRKKGVPFKSFWVVNALQVTGGQALIGELARQPEVAQIVASRTYPLPEPIPGSEQPRVDTIEWNIDRINAPQVWSTFGVRGEGIVVANIDTGVQFDHPALVAQYRGNLGGGSFDHNYNWFDPSRVCGDPSLIPCDNVDHGTHTMGTIVGDDGGANQIGVAPVARWIAAKGCESNWCSDTALLASAQWILAPTDLSGLNPRPDLRPHVINSSWGGWGGDPWYQGMVQAWVASGIFPAFSAGNMGDGCSSMGSPGDYPESYAAGAFDIGNNIAWFSSRGPSAFDGIVKPNIAAPGVGVRSSVPGGSYAAFDGTSMASPHVAGTVALIWSAAPAILSDIAATRDLLDQTAIDTADLACGGTPENNNVWGEGRLDAFAAVDQSPRGPTGTLQGTVTETGTGLPIAGATVRALGPSVRTTYTDGSGSYSFLLPIGSYDVTASAFGYLAQTVNGVVIDEGATTVQDFALSPAPAYSVSGHVRNNLGQPIANATVTILNTPLSPAFTDADGFYSFPSVPEGSYDVRAEAGRCNDPQVQQLILSGDVSDFDFVLPIRMDEYGYYCTIEPFSFVDANTVIPLSGDDSALQVDLPFAFPFYGQMYDVAYVTTNGFLNFLGPDARYWDAEIPDPESPNAAIYPFWDDLFVDEAASVRTETLGEAPNRQFVIEWRDVAFCCISAERVRFEVILHENGRILVQYTSIDDNGREQGNSATVGIENEAGTIALQYSSGIAALTDGLAVHYALPPGGFVEGWITDALDGTPIRGATVTALEAGRSTRSDENGYYRMRLPVGTYTLQAAADNYVPDETVVDVQEDVTLTVDFALRSARAQIDPQALEFLVPQGQARTKTLALSNGGLADLAFEIGEVLVAHVAAPDRSAWPQGADSRTKPAGYTPRSVASTLTGGPVLVFLDAFPWGSDALFQVLTANGIPYDTASSWQMGGIDLSPYEVVFLSNDQPQGFYDNYAANVSWLADYVSNGGFLWFGAAAWGWNDGDFQGGQLPGGATVRGPVFEDLNDVTDNAHPTMQGVPNPFFGTSASHAAFENLPAGTNVIAQGQGGRLPTLIEYELGAGKVLAFGQTLEFGFMAGQDAGLILENSVPYAYLFEPAGDIPWLSEDPASGTVAPGASQQIAVTVDTAGLASGLYRARLLVRTNDPHNSTLIVPVTVVVPAYMQAANVGGKAYTDSEGDLWVADRQYTAGSWGYVNRSQTLQTKKAISGTEDDPLYQDLRQGVLEYRFDQLPAGTYQIELRFAEIKPTQPNRRVFDVTIEGNLVLYAHDIALEVGSLAADDRTFYAAVTDGRLNVRFIPRRGYGQPILNAIRVTHRPDL